MGRRRTLLMRRSELVTCEFVVTIYRHQAAGCESHSICIEIAFWNSLPVRSHVNLPGDGTNI